ncbi:hypothetical protein LB518_23015 [Mesorhizobium sp. BR1-1-16]|uniref:hypothetical protein n=1 Tax=Mesorhizobium sp. BR1-1-16 TaxID=2876653 RepID=UPI001CCC3D7D|nr:hypothetical protein [Mesorhizobium sp. BR1-1-16]MBZ9939187.1 hypothetical protein [Mesorhizobium sp. BR1-1-16]
MAKKIEDAIREAEAASCRILLDGIAALDMPTDQAAERYEASLERIETLRAAQARGETTVEDGE